MQTVTIDNYKSFLTEKVAVLDFWATWCGPCKMMSPVVEKLAETYEGRVAFGSVNVDAEEQLAINYGISAIPTLIFFKDGEAVKKTLGVRPESELVGILDELLK